MSLPKCPSCNKRCKKHHLTKIVKQLQDHLKAEPNLAKFLYKDEFSKAYECLTSSKNRWACDDCIDQDKVILADIYKQTYCLDLPYFVYVNQHKICRTCHTDFIFSREEQQFWYEKLQFWVMSKAVDCKSCRASKKARKIQISEAQSEIEQFKPHFDAGNITHLQKMILLYQQTESHNIVEGYQARLSKLLSNI